MIRNVTFFAGLFSLASVLAGQGTPALQTTDFAPLRGAAKVPLLPEHLWWAIGVTVFFFLAFAVWIIRSSGSSKIDEAERINPLNIALDAIRELEGRVDTIGAREFSSAVSEVVRRYIEQACEIPAQEQTTEEFLNSIQSHPYFSDEVKAPLEKFLGLCDMAKFAQQAVDADQRHELLKEAGLLVEKLYRFVVKRAKAEATPSPVLRPQNA